MNQPEAQQAVIPPSELAKLKKLAEAQQKKEMEGPFVELDHSLCEGDPGDVINAALLHVVYGNNTHAEISYDFQTGVVKGVRALSHIGVHLQGNTVPYPYKFMLKTEREHLLEARPLEDWADEEGNEDLRLLVPMDLKIIHEMIMLQRGPFGAQAAEDAALKVQANVDAQMEDTNNRDFGMKTYTPEQQKEFEEAVRKAKEKKLGYVPNRKQKRALSKKTR